MTPEATGPESLREKIAREVSAALDRVGTGVFESTICKEATDAILALLSPTVQEDAGWPEREADIAWLRSRKLYPFNLPVGMAEEVVEQNARIDRLLAIARSGSGGTGAPEGWVLVPREPTEAMLREADEMDAKLRADGFNGAEVGLVYATMLAAAPPPAGAGK